MKKLPKLTELYRAKIFARLTTSDGQPKVSLGPKDHLTKEIVENARTNKAELIAELQWLTGQSEMLHTQLNERGFAEVKSEVLGETVFFCNGENCKQPTGYNKPVSYTFEELHLLVSAEPEHLRQIHEAKRVFAGKLKPLTGEEPRLKL